MVIFDAGTKQPISTSTFFENDMNLRCCRMTREWFIEKRMFGEWVIRFWPRGEKYKGVKLRSNRIVYKTTEFGRRGRRIYKKHYLRNIGEEELRAIINLVNKNQ